MRAHGVGVEHIVQLDISTGHAIINVDRAGENAIVIFSSANVAQKKSGIAAALDQASARDFLLLQNETNHVRFAAEYAKSKGLHVVYSAAPFDSNRVKEVLPYVDTLVLNEVEGQHLAEALGVTPERLPVAGVLVTRGAKGASYQASGHKTEVPAFAVRAVDTTGAGDTYLGFFVAGLDAGLDIKGAMTFAAAGSALQVTRKGTADAIPSLTEVRDFLEENHVSQG